MLRDAHRGLARAVCFAGDQLGANTVPLRLMPGHQPGTMTPVLRRILHRSQDCTGRRPFVKPASDGQDTSVNTNRRKNRVAKVPAGTIDCDVHPALPGMATLMPFLEPYWRETFAFRGIDKLDMSLTGDPRQTPLHARPDWRQPGGDGAADVAQQVAVGRQARGRAARMDQVVNADGSPGRQRLDRAGMA